MGIPFVDLRAQYAHLKDAIDGRIRAVLDHGGYIMGPEVAELEAALAEFAGCRYAIGLSSGTDALLVALMAAGAGPGDAVFLPAFTFSATAEVVALTGASPVFVDVEAATFNIDPADLSRRIEATARAGRLRPRVVIPVDLFGLPADYPALKDIAATHGLLLLADAAQGFGGVQAGVRAGALAPVTAVSFFPAKPLGCYGDGGALLTDDQQVADLARSIRLHGKGTGKYEIVRVGLNARLDTLQAAILLAKLPDFARELDAREALARLYDSELAGAVTLPPRVPGSRSAWAQYSIQHPERDRLVAALKAEGIPTAVYYPRPMHLQPAYAAYGEGPGSLPVSEGLCDRILSLPMHPYMDEETGRRIAAAVVAAARG